MTHFLDKWKTKSGKWKVSSFSVLHSPLSTFCVMLFLGGMFALPIHAAAQESLNPNATPGERFATAVVVTILDEKPEDFGGVSSMMQTLKLRMMSGPDTGKEWMVQNAILGDRPDMRYVPGDRVVVDAITKVDGSKDYMLREKYRIPELWWILIGFVLLACICGGWTALSSIAGLAVSVLILAVFLVPKIVAGGDPLVIGLISAVAIACTSLYVAHGFNRRTTVSLVATLITLVCSAVLAVLAVHLTSLFGVGSEEAFLLQTSSLQNIDLRGLLLAGIMIGSLGVLDDVTTAQVASIAEVSRANHRLMFKDLVHSGKAIGREHIASLINTLALAYVGTSLPLLLLFKLNDSWPLWVTFNSEFIAEEIVRTLVGSATLLLAVPISTWLAAQYFQGGQHVSASGGHGHAH